MGNAKIKSTCSRFSNSHLTILFASDRSTTFSVMQITVRDVLAVSIFRITKIWPIRMGQQRGLLSDWLIGFHVLSLLTAR